MKKEYLLHQREKLSIILNELNNRVADQKGGEVSAVKAAYEQFNRPEMDHAQLINEKDTDFQITEMEFKKIDQINSALNRIAKGSYGLCEGCKGAIELKRLEIIPEANLCIECQLELVD